MATEALIKAVEQQEALDRISDQIQPLVRDAFKSAGPAGREEMFSWKNPEAPGIAHQTPEVMSVWEPMGALTEEMNFWPIEDVAINFAQV